MTTPATAREVLIAEAISDAAKLLIGIDALRSELATGTQALQRASQQLQAELALFEGRIGALAEGTRMKSAQHIASYFNEASRRAVEQQRSTASEAVRAMVAPAIDTAMLKWMGEVQRMLNPPGSLWRRWLPHVVTACTAAGFTWSATTLWLLR